MSEGDEVVQLLARYGEAVERRVAPAIAPGDVTSGGVEPAPPRRPSRMVLVAAAVLAVVVVAGAVVARSRSTDEVGVVDPAVTSVPSSAASVPSTAALVFEPSTWTPIAAGPLSGRENPSVIALDGRVLVVGGDRAPCADTGACVSPEQERGAAIYDPATDTWSSAAEPPETWRTSPGPNAVAVTDHEAVFASGSSLVLYDIRTDAWSTIDGVPGPDFDRQLVAMGNQLLVYWASSDTSGDIYRLDRATGTWSTLPVDPLGPSVERRMIPTATGAVLVATPPYAEPDPRWVRAARFDDGSGAWSRLPDQLFLGDLLWARAGNTIVAPVYGESDRGGQRRPNGGQFDATTGEPELYTDRPSPQGAGPSSASGFDDRWLVASGQAYRPADATWVALDPPAEVARSMSGATWIDGRLFVWGGATEQADGSTTFSSAGAVWTPPVG